jgi:hypothetical protein
MAEFYFWIAVTPIQKSVQGLFQSLLFGIFLQCPDMIPWACPTRWPPSSDIRSLSPWQCSEVEETLKKVISGVSGSTSGKFCFFIDGLDEYDGNVHELLGILKEISRSSSIKLCLSSPPWNAFDDILGQDNHLKLYLEDLTREDIQRYTFENLEPILVHSCPADLVQAST